LDNKEFVDGGRHTAPPLFCLKNLITRLENSFLINYDLNYYSIDCFLAVQAEKVRKGKMSSSEKISSVVAVNLT
jgi:hypothetical protein